MYGKLSVMLEQAFHYKFGDCIKAVIDRYSVRKFCRSGDVLIGQGCRPDILYFILKGIVMGFYLDENGKEVTKCFASENQFAGTESIFGAKKANFSVICLEDTLCMAIPVDIFSSTPEIRKEFNEILGNVIKPEVLKIENRQRNMFMLSAEERYREFLTSNASIANRIKQSYIASYIGIQPSSLSRIKRNIKK